MDVAVDDRNRLGRKNNERTSVSSSEWKKICTGRYDEEEDRVDRPYNET